MLSGVLLLFQVAVAGWMLISTRCFAFSLTEAYIQAFTRGCILLTSLLAPPWGLCQGNFSNIRGWFAVEFNTDTHVPLMISFNHFGDPLTFYVASLLDQNFSLVSDKIPILSFTLCLVLISKCLVWKYARLQIDSPFSLYFHSSYYLDFFFSCVIFLSPVQTQMPVHVGVKGPLVCICVFYPVTMSRLLVVYKDWQREVATVQWVQWSSSLLAFYSQWTEYHQ